MHVHVHAHVYVCVRVRVCVYACVHVCVREREREREQIIHCTQHSTHAIPSVQIISLPAYFLFQFPRSTHLNFKVTYILCMLDLQYDQNV